MSQGYAATAIWTRPPPGSLKCLSRDSVQKSPHACRPALHFFRCPGSKLWGWEGPTLLRVLVGFEGSFSDLPCSFGDMGITELSQVNRAKKQTNKKHGTFRRELPNVKHPRCPLSRFLPLVPLQVRRPEIPAAEYGSRQQGGHWVDG